MYLFVEIMSVTHNICKYFVVLYTLGNTVENFDTYCMFSCGLEAVTAPDLILTILPAPLRCIGLWVYHPTVLRSSSVDLLDFMPCHSQCIICHRPLFSIQFCLEPPLPSSSSSTRILLLPFLTPDLFQCSLVALLVRGHVMSTSELVC